MERGPRKGGYVNQMGMPLDSQDVALNKELNKMGSVKDVEGEQYAQNLIDSEAERIVSEANDVYEEVTKERGGQEELKNLIQDIGHKISTENDPEAIKKLEDEKEIIQKMLDLGRKSGLYTNNDIEGDQDVEVLKS